jgi:hypothetical protein
VNKLTDEIEIVTMLKNLRKTNLLTRISLSKYQRSLIPYFRENIIQEERVDEDEPEEKHLNHQNLLNRPTIE